MHLAELARLRQAAYRLFSLVLCYPDQGRLERVAMMAALLSQSSQETQRFAFFPRWQRLLDCLVHLDRRHHPDLEREYVHTFMHNSERPACLPYESAYVDPAGRSTGWVLTQVEAEYGAAGLALSPSLKELPDHVAVELEFMGFLCGQEAGAWEAGDAAEAARALQRQAGFLDRHLLRWFLEWTGQVALVAGGGLYSIVAEAGQGFLGHDRDLIAILLESHPRPPEVARGEGRRGYGQGDRDE